MKKIIVVLFLFIAGKVFAQSSEYKALDDKYGFKDLQFEMKESDFIKNKMFIKVVSNEVGLNNYKITDPKYLSVGDCKISNISVKFFKGELLSFYIETKGAVNSTCLLSAFKTSFGNPFQPNEYMEKYAWLGIRVSAIYQENSITSDATTYLSSVKVLQAYSAFDKQRAKANGTDL